MITRIGIGTPSAHSRMYPIVPACLFARTFRIHELIVPHSPLDSERYGAEHLGASSALCDRQQPY